MAKAGAYAIQEHGAGIVRRVSYRRNASFQTSESKPHPAYSTTIDKVDLHALRLPGFFNRSVTLFGPLEAQPEVMGIVIAWLVTPGPKFNAPDTAV